MADRRVVARSHPHDAPHEHGRALRLQRRRPNHARTFREVYDEKARGARVQPSGRPERSRARSRVLLRPRTPARVPQPRDSAGCHGRRRSRRGRLVDHPNHIEFETADGFPTLDDHFRWLTHVAVRELQADALATRVRQLVPRMLGRSQPLRDKDVDRIRARFAKLRDLEARAIAAVHPLPPAGGIAAADRGTQADKARRTAARRGEFDRVASWTWHFVPGFLRELALADTVDNYRARAARSEHRERRATTSPCRSGRNGPLGSPSSNWRSAASSPR